MNDHAHHDPRLYAIPDIHGHAKGEHKAFSDERPIPLSARMLFLWFYHACRRGWPRFMMVTDHMNYLTFEDPAAINLVRRALKLAQAGDLYGAAETASVEVGHAAVVSEGLRRGMRYSLGAEVDNDPRSRPDAQNIVDAMKPDGMIRSVHFLTIDHPTHGQGWNWPFDNPEFADVYDIVGTAKTWELYMATLLDAVERLPGNIVGHFYVPALFGHWPDDATLDAYENQLVDACEARGMAIELNTRFLYRDHSDEEKARYLNAHRRLLAKCKAKNVGIAVGSDAHSPKDQGGAFETVLALLDECAINELVFPIAGRLARVALRVERKAEPVPEAAPEERRAVRKPRPVEPVPESAPATAVAAETVPAHIESPVKSKPRPKRSRSKGADSADTPAVEAVADAPAAEAPAGISSPGVNGSAPLETMALASIAADPSVASEDSPAAAHVAPPAPTHVEGAPEAAAAKPAPRKPAPRKSAASKPAAVQSAAVEAGPGANGARPHPADESDAVGEAIEDHVDIRAPETASPASPTVVEVIQETMGDGLSDIVIDAEFEPIVADATAEAPAADAMFEEAAGELLASAPEPEPILEATPRPIVRKSRPKPPPPKARTSATRAKSAAKARPAAKKTAKSVVKAGAKKTAAKKTAAKKAAPKLAAKRPAAKKDPVKKAAVKKAAARGAAPKKTSAKKTAVKKTSAKKPAQRRR